MLSPADTKKIYRLEKRISDLEKEQDIDRKIINEVTHAYYIESEFRNDELKLLRGLENEVRAKK